MVNKIYVLLQILCLAGTTLAQSDFWLETGSPDDVILALSVDNNGVVLAGSHRVFGNRDIALRSDDEGETWNAIFNNLPEGLASIRRADDGGLWAGTTGAGLFHSANEGTSWNATSLTGELVWTIAYNSQRHIFTGGHGPPQLGLGGVRRSTDGGQTWDKLFNGFQNISDVLTIKSGARDYLYAACRSGLYRSKDNGDSWQLMGLENTTCNDVIIALNGTILIATGGGIYRFNDSDDRLTPVNSGLTHFNVRALAANSVSEVFAGTFGGGVFRSDDNGASWREENSGLAQDSVLTLALSPDEILYAGTQSGVYRSTAAVTSVSDNSSEPPASFVLHHNFPNPFNPGTTIAFELPRAADVVLKIYNLAGQEVRSLVHQPFAAGSHNVAWDGQDNFGKTVASGILIYRLQAGGRTAFNKMTLLK